MNFNHSNTTPAKPSEHNSTEHYVKIGMLVESLMMEDVNLINYKRLQDLDNQMIKSLQSKVHDKERLQNTISITEELISQSKSHRLKLQESLV